MQVYLNSITGIDDAFVSLLMSKQSWTREKELGIRQLCKYVNSDNGCFCPGQRTIDSEYITEYNSWMDKFIKYIEHITLGRFIDLSVTVQGLHRAGQDDWDAHAARFNTRIVRASTRLSNFTDEVSEFYQGKIIPTDQALKEIGFQPPSTIDVDGVTYVKTVNGYVREDMRDDKDVTRGLYMLSIPSNFIFKVNLTEFAHVYKMRGNHGHANPEVKKCCESICDQLEQFQPRFTRELLMKIPN